MNAKDVVENLEIHEIARQPNEISRAKFHGTANSYKLIVFALFKTLKCKNPIEPNKKNVYLSFTDREFCNHLDIPFGTNTQTLIKKSCTELAKSVIEIETKEKWSIKPWFTSIDYLPHGAINIKFNPEIMDFLTFETGYSALELAEFGSLQSFYALRYYSLAKSKMGYDEPWFEFTEEELRDFFKLGKTQYADRFDLEKRVIAEPLNEINEKTLLKIDVEKTKISKGKYKYHFSISKRNKELKILKADTLQTKRDKQEINEEEKLIAENTERFAELFEEEKQQPALFGGEIFARAAAVSRLKKEKELGLL